MKQKFKSGTFVHISGDFPTSRAHFAQDCPALICYTYKQMYGGDDFKTYALMIREKNGTWRFSAWYNEYELTSVTDRDLLKQYRSELKGKSVHIISEFK